MTTDLTALPWRTDGQTVLACREPYGRDEFAGRMDSAELAREACESHNEALARRKLARHGVTGSAGVQFGSGNSQTNVF